MSFHTISNANYMTSFPPGFKDIKTFSVATNKKKMATRYNILTIHFMSNDTASYTQIKDAKTASSNSPACCELRVVSLRFSATTES